MKSSLLKLSTRVIPRTARNAPVLVHVGTRKAASTYLQSCFASQRNLRTASLERLEQLIFEDSFSNASLDSLLRRRAASLPQPQWSGLWPGSYSIVTNERFAINPRLMKFAPRGERASAFYDRYWALNVAYLKKVVPQGKIFVVTRSPDAWVKSNYSQAVRGAIALHRFPVFARRNREYILENLNYQRMQQLFGEAFGEENVLFLPQEMLRGDEAGFFDLLSSFAGYRINPPPAKPSSQGSVNKSPDALELDRLLIGWRFLRLLDRHGRREHFAFYKNFLLKKGRDTEPNGRGGPEKIERLFKFFYRNDIEFTNARGQRVWESVKAALPAPPGDVGEFSLPEDLRLELLSNCAFLSELPGYEQYADIYRP